MKTASILIIVFISISFYACSDKKITESSKQLIGMVDKAYINRHLPINDNEKSMLFFECRIINNTSHKAIFKFRYNPSDEGMHNLYVVTNKNDTISLFSRYRSETFEVQPMETKNIDFSIDFTEELFKESHSYDYLTFVDSLASIIDKIIYRDSSDSTFTFNKSKDYTMEYRLLEYFSVGEGYKE